MSPESTIKASSGGWNSLIPYIDQHPDRVFMISCAGFDPIGADFKEDLLNHEEYPPLVSLLAHPNVILSFCVGNAVRTAIKTLNEEEAEQEL